jgi:hypothetical protein
VSRVDRFEIEWHWEGDLKVAVLPDGTTVRSGKQGLDFREKIQSILSDRGVDARYLYFRQVGERQERRTPRRRS